jgi:AcrR family transcriptional regulator
MDGISLKDPQQARSQVLRAADALFYQRGIQAVGMDAVRNAAGISLKRLYSLFPSKDALLVEVLNGRILEWDEGVSRASSSATTPKEKLLAIYEFLDGWFRQDDFRGCAFINSFGELGAVSPDVAEIARGQKLGFQHYVANLVEELGGSPALAAQLAILAEGAQTTAAISGQPDAAFQARAAAEILIARELAA